MEDQTDFIYKEKKTPHKYVIEESMSIGHTDTEEDKDLT